MSAELSARLATPADAELLAELDEDPEVRPWIVPNTPEGHRRQMADPDLRTLIATDPDGLVGYAILAGLQEPHGNREIRRLVGVRRGRGLGRRLLDLVVGHCFGALGAHRCWLDALPENARALHLYRSYGFVDEGTRREAFRTADGIYRSLVVLSLLPHERPATARLDALVVGAGSGPEPA